MNTCKQKHSLFHDGSSCHIETSPLICTANQSMNWFLYNKDLCHLHPPYTKSLFLHFVSHNSPFFLPGFLSGIFTIYRITHEGGGYLLISFLLLLPASQTLRHQLDYCCRELTSAQLAARTEHGLFGTRSLVFTLPTLTLVAAVVRRLLKTQVTLGNISCVLLNLFKSRSFKSNSSNPCQVKERF